jgi:hypothetical protein
MTSIDELRAAVTRAQQGRARAEGAAASAEESHAAAMAALKAEFGAESLDEARVLLAEAQDAQVTEEQRVRELLDTVKGIS